LVDDLGRRLLRRKLLLKDEGLVDEEVEEERRG